MKKNNKQTVMNSIQDPREKFLEILSTRRNFPKKEKKT